MVDVAGVMEAYSLDAVDFARLHFHIELDYSEESLKHVEGILGRYHNDLIRAPRKPSDEEIWTAAKMWGGYIGEVIRKRWGGEWTDSSGAYPGEFVYTLRVPISLGTRDVFPPFKAGKRITNGPEDNIWYYYRISFYGNA